MTEPKSSKNRAKALKQAKASQQAPEKPQVNENEPDKFDIEIAKFLRYELPDKQAVFGGIKRVNYFIGSKAVDLLLESKYSSKFKTREGVVDFLHSLLLKNFYHRARKIVKVDGTKKRFKLDMHDRQYFEDSKEPYVWLYEPTPLKAWLMSIGLIFLVVAVCLFPLWPQVIRTGVYYICIASLIVLTSFIGLSFVRYIIYGIVWAFTLGHVNFWFLPNLTEDVGFFESFVPVYTFE